MGRLIGFIPNGFCWFLATDFVGFRLCMWQVFALLVRPAQHLVNAALSLLRHLVALLPLLHDVRSQPLFPWVSFLGPCSSVRSCRFHIDLQQFVLFACDYLLLSALVRSGL